MCPELLLFCVAPNRSSLAGWVPPTLIFYLMCVMFLSLDQTSCPPATFTWRRHWCTLCLSYFTQFLLQHYLRAHGAWAECLHKPHGPCHLPFFCQFRVTEIHSETLRLMSPLAVVLSVNLWYEFSCHNLYASPNWQNSHLSSDTMHKTSFCILLSSTTLINLMKSIHCFPPRAAPSSPF